jgi:Mn-dependent DtxR family transcriptional regulator
MYGSFQDHTLLTKLLVTLGVRPETAAEDACRLEHAISDESFEAIKNHLESFSK